MTRKTWLMVAFVVMTAAMLFAFAGDQEKQKDKERVFFFSSGGSWLGVNIADVDSDRAKALGLKEERGAEIQSVVPDSPAAQAGLKEGDVILEFQGTNVEGVSQLTRLVRETPSGRTVTLQVWRDRGARSVQVKMSEREKDQHFGKQMGALRQLQREHRHIEIPPIDIPEIHIPEVMALGGPPASPRLGASVENLTDQLGEFFGVKGGRGVLVRSVRKGSAGEAAGLQAGDVIVKVDDEKIEDSSDLRLALRDRRGKELKLTVVREKRERTLGVAVAKDEASQEQEEERTIIINGGDDGDDEGEDAPRPPHDDGRMRMHVERQLRDVQARQQYQEAQRAQVEALRAQTETLREQEAMRRAQEALRRSLRQGRPTPPAYIQAPEMPSDSI